MFFNPDFFRIFAEKFKLMEKTIGIGNALVDVLVRLDGDELLERMQLPKGGMTLISEGRQRALRATMELLPAEQATGGSAGNAMLALAGLGGKAGFVGKVGRDALGRFYADHCRAAGIDACLFECDLPTGVANTFISPDGERTFGTCLGAAAALEPRDITPALFEGVGMAHIEGYLVQNHELIEKAIRLAKESGCMVSLDLASYNVVNENHAFLKDLVKQYVDIVFANEDESFAYTHLNPEESVQMIAEQCDIAVVKVGKNGSYVQQGSKRHHIGAITTSCTDSTGAGDLFAGGFLHALSDGFDIRRCAEIGTIAAGRVVEIVGTKLSDETWEEIRRICALYRGFMQKYDN